jgi:hypothetical protein
MSLDIDDMIKWLETQSLALKVHVNANYKSISSNDIQDLCDKRNGIKQEIRRLNTIKLRRKKILKIRNRC